MIILTNVKSVSNKKTGRYQRPATTHRHEGLLIGRQ